MGRSRVSLVGLMCAVATVSIAQVSPNGPEFQVNTYTTSYQYHPRLGVDAQGNFVVAWMSLGSGGTDTSEFSIQAQRFAANGAPLGGEFQVNTYTTNSQRNPRIAVSAQGDFVVAWDSWFASSGTDTSGNSIQAQRFAANGAPLGGEFQVNTYTTEDQRHPGLGVDAQGNFVVAWHSVGSGGTDTSGASIQAQRFAANGAPLGGEFQVNTITTYGQWDPELGVDAQGNFVVAWMSDVLMGTGAWGHSIQAQRFAANGAPLGDEFQVNTYTTKDQYSPRVAAAPSGEFVVAWSSGGSWGNDDQRSSVQARRYGAEGSPLDAQEFQVNGYTESYQLVGAVIADPLGNFVVAWYSDGSNGSDWSYFSVQARRFDAHFRDGFEAGDTSRWSLAAP
jgi:hypothetical protein